MNRDFWRGKRVLLTGHSGFKGGWLSLWLSEMEAEVHGYSLAPLTHPNLFSAIKLEDRISSSVIGDIRDADGLSAATGRAKPDIVLHLAAQPLVRHSYVDPVETYAVNVMGTVNLFEAVRRVGTVRAMVNVTTDKCYENREWVWPYRENEAIGGFDPYSSSKACSELVTSAYRQSFFAQQGVQVATARAGNVIGGGDWAKDRLVPDFLRSIDAGKTLVIRSPNAIRPWQHVLEPLAGYLMLAEQLYEQGGDMAGAWNFGPDDSDARSVQWIVKRLCNQVAGASWSCGSAPQPHEANSLKLDSSKAKVRLGWSPRWDLATALEKTLAWHQTWKSGSNMTDYTLTQISDYESIKRS